MLVLWGIVIIHKRWFNIVTSVRELIDDDTDSMDVVLSIVIICGTILLTVFVGILISMLGIIATLILTPLIVCDIVSTHFKSAWRFICSKITVAMDMLENKGTQK